MTHEIKVLESKNINRLSYLCILTVKLHGGCVQIRKIAQLTISKLLRTVYANNLDKNHNPYMGLNHLSVDPFMQESNIIYKNTGKCHVLCCL